MSGGGGEIEETAEQKALAEVAVKKWQDYQAMFVPAENDFMGKVDRMNSEQQYNQAGALARTATRSSFGDAVTQNAKVMASQGVDPTSGKFQVSQKSITRQGAEAEADIVNRSQVGQADRYVGGLKAISAMGQGMEADAVQGMSDIASTSGQYAQNSALNARQNQEIIGDVAGAALGMTYANYTRPKPAQPPKAEGVK